MFDWTAGEHRYFCEQILHKLLEQMSIRTNDLYSIYSTNNQAYLKRWFRKVHKKYFLFKKVQKAQYQIYNKDINKAALLNIIIKFSHVGPKTQINPLNPKTKEKKQSYQRIMEKNLNYTWKSNFTRSPWVFKRYCNFFIYSEIPAQGQGSHLQSKTLNSSL